jgi:hypothetical protein
MHMRYQDLTAIVRKFGKPDLFVTVTCNPEWPEMAAALLESNTPADRPEIVAHVFELKLDALVKEVEIDRSFGETVACRPVVDAQKRGLQHAHILIFLKKKINTAVVDTQDVVDDFVCAEVPTDNLKLQNIVLDEMIHGPSGAVDPNAWCMRATGCCWKDFPKAFAATTEWHEDGAHPTHRRRASDAGGYSGVDARGCGIANRWVVPYSPYLTLKYGAHINIQVCSSTRAFKYLMTFKYVVCCKQR